MQGLQRLSLHLIGQTLEATTLRLGNTENLGHCLQPEGTPTCRSKSGPACQRATHEFYLFIKSTAGTSHCTLTEMACFLADVSSRLSGARLRDIGVAKGVYQGRLIGIAHQASGMPLG